MAVGIHKIIAAIVPDIYCKPGKRAKVKKIAAESGYLKAAEEAEVVDSTYFDLKKETFAGNPFKYAGIKKPLEKHWIKYDVFSQSLEPIYYWFLDYMAAEYKGYEKVIDNFVASPQSSQFAEIGGRATRMQEEAMKIFGTINTVIRSVLNLIYDLKEFKLVLEPYDSLKSPSPEKRNSAYLGLKQRWMDMVDIRRGAGAINSMAQQLDFVTLRDAFMVVNTLEKVDELDLNDRVKRILKIKVSEFQTWIKQSEQELRKRFEIEKVYLKSQVNSIKLYARWLKPYLKAAKDLEMRADANISKELGAQLVNSFNSTILELTLLGQGKFKIPLLIRKNELPASYVNITSKKYMPFTVIDLKFISAPERVGQGGYGYRGKIEIEFTGYALNDTEIEVLRQELEKDDVGDLMSLVEGSTTDSLDQIQSDIDELLNEAPIKSIGSEENNEANPFTSLFSFFKAKKIETNSKLVPLDNWQEKAIRDRAIMKSRVDCRSIYGAFKGSNNMPSFF